MFLICYTECISTPGKLKSLPDHGGNQTCDVWGTSPMLHQLSYEAKSVRVWYFRTKSSSFDINVF